MAGNPADQGYIDVPQRIAEFREKYPNGCLQPVDLNEPVRVVSVGDKTFLQYVAAAYRTPDDARPGIGTAWEVFPGKTPFTKDSEAMNVETSAWGRAIVAVLAADTKQGIASQTEVMLAQERQKVVPAPDGWRTLISDANNQADLEAVKSRAVAEGWFGPNQKAALNARFAVISRG